jgi:hypothetical protein
MQPGGPARVAARHEASAPSTAAAAARPVLYIAASDDAAFVTGTGALADASIPVIRT